MNSFAFWKSGTCQNAHLAIRPSDPDFVHSKCAFREFHMESRSRRDMHTVVDESADYLFVVRNRFFVIIVLLNTMKNDN